MWTNKFTDMINPLPAGDTAFVIVALETIAKTLRGGRAEESFLADMLKIIIGAESKTTTVKGDANTTEAAVRTYAESLKNSTVLCKLNELAYMQQMSAQNHV